MKKIVISSIFMSIFFSLFLFSFYANPLESAIIPKWAVLFSVVTSFLNKSSRSFIIILYLLGLFAFSYTIHLVAETIQERIKNWWKTGYFAFIIAVVLLYGFIFSQNFYFFPITIFKLLPINNTILSCLVFSTILLLPLKKWKKHLINYIVFLISYLLILHTYGNALLVNKNFSLFFSPVYVILLYLLVYHFIINRKLYPYLVIFLLFIPLKIRQRKIYEPFYKEKKTVEYTMIIPSESYYKVEKFERPFTSGFSYRTILELDSMIYYEKNVYKSYSYIFQISRSNLNEERLKLVKEPLNNKKLHVGRRYREKIGEIIKRWESGKERGIITGKIEEEIPDKIGLLKYTRDGFTWTIKDLWYLADAVSPAPDGGFVFRYIPPDKYRLLLFYKKRVSHFRGKISIVESNNDTINLGSIEIR